jgi:hypothetical protein
VSDEASQEGRSTPPWTTVALVVGVALVLLGLLRLLV